MDPIKYIFEKPALSGRIARWQMILTEYDIQYTTQKAIKGSVVADHLAHQAVDDYQLMSFEFPDEDIMIITKEPGQYDGPEQGSRWTMVFDGASNALGNGVGVVIISPERIITDNGSNLNNTMITDLCMQIKIKHHNSSPYRPKMNGAVEAANKNIKKILQKMTVTYKDWHEMLPFSLHGYRTTIRTSTGATPFSLVYGMEAVLPIEVQIPSLRIMKDAGLDEDEWIQTRLDQINLIDEKRLAVVCHGQMYQKRMIKAFNKKVKPKVYQAGDLVIKRIILPQGDPRGKWTPTYEGPFVVKRVFSGGAMMLTTMDGEDFPQPVNADIVKKYYA